MNNISHTITMNIISSGKVRDIYAALDNSLIIAVSDRVSAFDVIMNDPIPGKGELLNKLSEFWLNFTSGIVPNHLISTDLNDFPPQFQTPEFAGRSSLVKKLKMLPVECIVRGYVIKASSSWNSYFENGTMCGVTLPTGLQDSEKLPVPLFTPSTKAELGDHDENISFEQMCELIGQELAEQVRKASLDVYTKCAEYAATRGIIIADTKFEFGLDENGALTLADEVLTPDSSRFWDASTYAVGRGQDSYDKQPLRDWLAANGYKGKRPDALPADVIAMTAAKYKAAYDMLVG